MVEVDYSKLMDEALDLNSGPAAVAFHMKDGDVLYEIGRTKYDALSDTQCGSPTSRRDIKFYTNIGPAEMRGLFGAAYDDAIEGLKRGPFSVVYMGKAKGN